MTAKQQARRRALKAERRALDRIAQQIAAASNSAHRQHAPSTRAHQAKRNHQVAAELLRATGQYDALRARMAAIAAELARAPETPTLKGDTP